MDRKGQTGHRQRLEEGFLAGAQGSHSQEGLLELLLTFAIARKDVRPIAQELIRVFGSLSEVLSASPNELSKVKGVGQSSVVLLKAVDSIRSYSTTDKSKYTQDKRLDGTEPMFFEASPENPDAEVKSMDSSFQPKNIESKSTEQKSNSVSAKRIQHQGTITSKSDEVNSVPEASFVIQDSNERPTVKKIPKRKMQISNGHYLQFDQLARLIYAVNSFDECNKIKMADLEMETGLPFRQVRNRVSIGRAMGLFEGKSLCLTAFGKLISLHDPFFESRATLEYLHYKAAGNFTNLIWHEVFNDLLVNEDSKDYKEWIEYFRKRLSNDYSEHTLKDHLGKEIRFIINAYIEQNFKKLELLHQDSTGHLYIRRYLDCSPLVFSAMVYDFCNSRGAQLFQVGEMAVMPGSPALVFGLDPATFRHQIEELHDQGWLRYETTHNLDQIRLKPGFSAIEFLTAHFEDRTPLEISIPSPGDLFE